MSLATDKLEIIREQVQYHLDHAEQKKLTPEQEEALKDDIKARLVKENAVIVAHYYTAPAIQALAEETGGCVSDSLEMARFGHDHPAETLIVPEAGHHERIHPDHPHVGRAAGLP